MTSLRNLMSVLQRLQSIWEKLCHFFRGCHIILTAFIAHSIIICQLLVCLQTEKNIVRCCIFCHCIMHIVGCYQINSCFFVHTEKLLINYLLFRNSMILQFQEEVSFSKNILISQSCCLRIFVHASLKISGYFTCQAGT